MVLWALAEWIILALALVCALSIVWSAVRLGITPTPSPAKARHAILQLLAQEQATQPKASQDPNEASILYELGAGWGTLAFPIAQAHPHLEVRAFEASPVPWLWLVLRQWFAAHPRLSIHRDNFFDTPLNDASFVVCYLYTGAMKRLRHKFEQECAPGTLVLTHTFSIPGWEAEHVAVLQDLYRSRVYLYRVPHKESEELI